MCANYLKGALDILLVDIDYGKKSDSEDEEGCCLEDENTTDNPLDNASSGNVVILDPSVSYPRSKCYCTRMAMITAICFTWPYYIILKSVFRLLLLNKKRKCYQSI